MRTFQMKLAPSILSADFAYLARDIEHVEALGADYLHVDVMDGHFVPNITLGVPVVESIRKVTKLPLDVHLMIENPEHYITQFINAGADIVTIHAESTVHLHAVLQKIRKLGAKAGVVINPATPVTVIEPVLRMVDQVLIMTVNPGFGGQQFLLECLEKIQEVSALRAENNYPFDIEVDGGIDEETIVLAKNSGANVFVAGSYIFQAEDVAERIGLLREKL